MEYPQLHDDQSHYSTPDGDYPTYHPPSYLSRPAYAGDDTSSVYGGHAPPTRVGGPSLPSDKTVFRGTDFDQQSSFDSVRPDDSISVVGGQGGAGRAGAPVKEFGGENWKYVDPYSTPQNPYADPPRPQQGQFNLVAAQGEREEAIRWGGGSEETSANRSTEPVWRDSDYLNPDMRGRDRDELGLSPSAARGYDRDSYADFDDREGLYPDNGRAGSMSKVSLVGAAGGLAGHSRRDSDQSTVVGSYRDALKQKHPSEGASMDGLDYESLYARGRTDGQRGSDEEVGEAKYPPMTIAAPSPSKERPPLWKRLIYDTTPMQDKIELYTRGIGVQQRPWLCWILGLGMVGGLIAEMVRNWQEQGSPISTSPTFNYMIGPSSSIMINTGARFTPCIKYVSAVASLNFSCLNVTTSTSTCTTTLEYICGFGGWGTGEPDQKFRFILPIFLHAGIVHLALNLLVQLTSSASIERQMGSLRFLLVFIPAGVFGFLAGGNFSLVGIPSVGASGAIYGTHAAVLVDLIAHWGIEYRPGRKLTFLLVEIIVGLGVGLIPGINIDNLSHFGGFIMGLLLTMLLFPMIHQTRRHRFIFIVLRLLSAVLAIVLFVLLWNNFQTDDPQRICKWCKFLSCFPTSSNNHCQGTGLTTTSTSGSSNRRALASLPLLVISLSARWRQQLHQQ